MCGICSSGGLKLGLTEYTVSDYLFCILDKLGISSRIELAVYVIKDRERSDAASGLGNGSQLKIETA